MADIVKINKICRNGINNNISLKIAGSPCNQNYKLALYGSENSILPFVFIDSISNTNNFVHGNANVPFNKNWSYFLLGTINCGGANIMYISDTVLVDVFAPQLSVIDSVSVITGSNTVVIGWRQNTDKDFSHFSLFNYNRSDPRVAEILRDSTYRDSLSGNVNSTVLSYEITTVDSCGNRAAFGSGAHSTIVLQANADTCKSEIKLNWTPYKGWQNIKRYYVFKRINSGTFFITATLPENETTYTDKSVTQANQYEYFVRATKDTGIIVTSSSNSVAVNVGKRNPNAAITIKQVSVENNNIEVEINRDQNSIYGYIYLLKEVNNKYEKVNEFKLNDIIKTNDDPNIINKYRILWANVCNYPEDTSVFSNNIVLNLKEETKLALTWNNYFTWNSGIKEYLIYRANGLNKGATINYIEISNTNNLDFYDIAPEEEISCYYIAAIESGGEGVSKSNIRCNQRDGSVYYPNAINLSGINNRFSFVGIGIDFKNTSFSVYNRYGELIFNTNSFNNEWYGTNNNGESLPLGVYFFTSTIKLNNGETIEKRGNITIIR